MDRLQHYLLTIQIVSIRIESSRCTHRLASSADWVMKKPMELAGILAMCGLMQILGSPPSSLLTSIASSSSFSLMKHSLHSKALYSTEAYLPHSSHEIWTKNWAKIVQKSVIFECACKLQESQGTKSPNDDLVSKNKREKKRKKRTLVCSLQPS